MSERVKGEERVFVPDESGMGGDWRTPGEVYWDPDNGRWMEFIDQFRSRPARRLHTETVAKTEHDTPVSQQSPRSVLS